MLQACSLLSCIVCSVVHSGDYDAKLTRPCGAEWVGCYNRDMHTIRIVLGDIACPQCVVPMSVSANTSHNASDVNYC